MKTFTGKVAVITGAASGIGRGLADRAAREGMKVVLADIEAPALAQAEAELKAGGADVLAVVTDVSKPEEVEALAQRTLDSYGGVHLLCNNAGVGAGSTPWESTLNDWTWVLGVNLWGVIHGVRAFVPLMLAQDDESHIVNTASVAGLVSWHGCAPYLTSKHAVVGLSEHLYYDLANRTPRVKVSVLCPGWVTTQILESERNRPAALTDEPTPEEMTPEMEAILANFTQACENGMPCETVADHVFRAIREERFYILTHPEFVPYVQSRMAGLVAGSNPPLQG